MANPFVVANLGEALRQRLVDALRYNQGSLIPLGTSHRAFCRPATAISLPEDPPRLRPDGEGKPRQLPRVSSHERDRQSRPGLVVLV